MYRRLVQFFNSTDHASGGGIIETTEPALDSSPATIIDKLEQGDPTNVDEYCTAIIDGHGSVAILLEAIPKIMREIQDGKLNQADRLKIRDSLKRVYFHVSDLGHTAGTSLYEAIKQLSK